MAGISRLAGAMAAGAQIESIDCTLRFVCDGKFECISEFAYCDQFVCAAQFHGELDCHIFECSVFFAGGASCICMFRCTATVVCY